LFPPVDNIERLLESAKSAGTAVFVSPHYYYPHDQRWEFGGTLEQKMHEIGMFDRRGPLYLEGFSGSGADWLAQYDSYLTHGETVVTSPHHVPQNDDLVLQLRKRRINPVVLAGMSANLCVESHLRHLLDRFRGRGRGRRDGGRTAPYKELAG
jgi:nicotinamidase-related amidase